MEENLFIKLYIIDNSPNPWKIHLNESMYEYIYNKKNLGYGKAHNIAMRRSLQDSKFHLVINPDISFEKGTIKKIFSFMVNNPLIGQLMPKVIYPNGEIQYLCKLLPNPIDLAIRRFLPKNSFLKNQSKFELRFTGYNSQMEVPFLSGCFMFLNNSALKDIGLFDERFFMYAEDIDLTRRIHEKFKTIYYPDVTIIHGHAKESFKNLNLFLIHFQSILQYFSKWGWIFDKKRVLTNKRILKNLGN